MQAEKQQPWRINIYARSKNFNFRFKATRSLPFPSWNFHRLSILFRIRRHFILRVKSESPVQQRPTLKSRLLRGFERFRARRSKKRSVAAEETLNVQPLETKSSMNHLRRLAHEVPVYIGSLVVGILAFLFRSTSLKVISFVILLILTMLLKKHVCGRRSMAALAFSVLSTVVFSMVFQLISFRNYENAGTYIAEFVWRAWDFICKSSSN